MLYYYYFGIVGRHERLAISARHHRTHDGKLCPCLGEQLDQAVTRFRRMRGLFRYIPTLVVIEHPGASGLDEYPIKLADQSSFACLALRRSPATYAGA